MHSSCEYYLLTGVSESIRPFHAFGSRIELGPLYDTQYFKVMKLAKGRYYWDKVQRKLSFYRREYADLTDQAMYFTVAEKAINFTGTFLYESVGNAFSARVADRSAINVEVFQENYPYLIHRFRWVNGFTPSDPFVEFYFSEKFNKGGK